MVFKRKTRKRTYVKRKPIKRRPRYPLLTAGMGPLGKSAVFKHVYFTQVQADAGIGTIKSVAFRANSMHDPEVALGGHQPYGYDQVSAFFYHYTVLGCKLTVTCASNNSIPIILYVGKSAQSIINATTAEELLEQGGYQYRLLQSQGSGGSKTTITSTMSMKKFFGVKNIAGIEPYRATIGSNPVEAAYFQVGIAPQWGSDDPASETIQVRLEYICHYSEPKELSQS